VKTLLQYLISAEEKNFPVIQSTLFGVMTRAARDQDISTKIRTYEQALHCISEVMQFAIDSNSSSLLELLYTVKD
jgi:hypothetical protein